MAEANKKVKVTQIKSSIGVIPKHKKTLIALGLNKIGRTKIHNDNPVMNGMIDQVRYLLKIERV